MRPIDSASAGHRHHPPSPGKEIYCPALHPIYIQRGFPKHGPRHVGKVVTGRKSSNDDIVQVNHITSPVFSIEIALNNLARGFVMSGDPLPQRSDEWVERKDLGVSVDSSDQAGGCNDIDLAIENIESEDWEAIFCAG